MINNKMTSVVPIRGFLNRLEAITFMAAHQTGRRRLFAAVAPAGDLPWRAYYMQAGSRSSCPAASRLLPGHRDTQPCRGVDDLTEACQRLLGVGASDARRLAGVLSPAAETARRSARPRGSTRRGGTSLAR